MLLKIVSLIASLILMFTPSVALPEKGDVLVETPDNLSENRTADEINGANRTKFYIQRPESDKLNEINASEFGLSESNADNFEAFQECTKLLLPKSADKAYYR